MPIALAPCEREHLSPSRRWQPEPNKSEYAIPKDQDRHVRQGYAKCVADRRIQELVLSVARKLVHAQQSSVCATLAPEHVAEAISVEQRFRRLADEWSKETMHISSASDLINDKRYQEIIALRWDVVPYLLKDLQQNKRFWFPALAEITGIRPFDPGDSSNPRRMTEAWVKWGKRKGLI